MSPSRYILLTYLGSQATVLPVTDHEPGRPYLAAPDGDPIAAAFTEAMNASDPDGEPSRPLALWWSTSRPDGGGVHIRITDDNGRWLITDVYVHGRGLSATDLQAIRLTQLDLIMNLVGYWDETGGGITDPGAIADAYNMFAAEAGYGHSVAEDLGEADEPSLAELRGRAADAPPDLPELPAAERPRLTRPDGTDPDGFAARVADAYREYARQTRAPAVKIADEAGVPVATARSWIREARRRGKLPQGRKGKAG